MTSKDKLKHLALNWSLRNEGDNRLSYNKEKELFDSLTKDLEILEILKNSLELKEDGGYLTINFKFCCYKEDLDRDYEIRTIKEWLENE